MRSFELEAFSIVVAIASVAPSLKAGSCSPEWLDTFAASAFSGVVYDMAIYDDGQGPALYMAGDYLIPGPPAIRDIAKWDGQTWHKLGTGLFLFNSEARALAVYDSGDGPELFVGGKFPSAGGSPAGNIAKWNGKAWSTPGGPTGMNDRVNAFAIVTYTDRKSALIAGGAFTSVPGENAKRIASWNGRWSGFLGGGIGDGEVFTIRQYPTVAATTDSVGVLIVDSFVVGGSFSVAGSLTGSVNVANIARWDGRLLAWKKLGSGTDGPVHALADINDPLGSTLYVGGAFDAAGGVASPKLARWNGTSWLPPFPSGTDIDQPIYALAPSLTGDSLYIGGAFTHIGPFDAMHHLVRMSFGSPPIILLTPLGIGVDDSVHAIGILNGKSGPVVLAGGTFVTAGGITSPCLAEYACPPPLSPADLDQDGDVDGIDLAMLLGQWGVCEPSETCQGDLNDDDIVDGTDLALLLAEWD